MNETKVFIENYRGWDILFDTEKETFYAMSDEQDRGEHKKSFASAKKYVDDFIKENDQFKPFWVQGIPDGWRDKKPVKVIGIRKDNRFVYESPKDGSQCQMSEWDEKDYMLINPENDVHFETIRVIDEQIEQLQQSKNEVRKLFKVVKLSNIKQNYIR